MKSKKDNSDLKKSRNQLWQLTVHMDKHPVAGATIWAKDKLDALKQLEDQIQINGKQLNETQTQAS